MNIRAQTSQLPLDLAINQWDFILPHPKLFKFGAFSGDKNMAKMIKLCLNCS
jgi:hypothetical protein